MYISLFENMEKKSVINPEILNRTLFSILQNSLQNFILLQAHSLATTNNILEDFSLSQKPVFHPQSPSDASNPSAQNPTVNGSCSVQSDQSPSHYHYNPTYIERQVIDNLKISEKNDLSMVFTCKVCNARNLKTACRESYKKGVVVSKCDSCDRFHLIVDRLGWFRESASVDEILAEQGEEVDDESCISINLTLPDGWKPVMEDVSS